MKVRILTLRAAAASFALLLGGCAAPRLYQWGGYDSQLSKAYKNPETTEAFRQSLQAHVAAMEQSRQKVAPGLYAELGTLYFQVGDRDRALALYTKERDAWPESKGLMDALISNITRQKAPASEVKS